MQATSGATSRPPRRHLIGTTPATRRRHAEGYSNEERRSATRGLAALKAVWLRGRVTSDSLFLDSGDRMPLRHPSAARRLLHSITLTLLSITVALPPAPFARADTASAGDETVRAVATA